MINIFWVSLSTVFSILLSALMCYKLTAWRSQFNWTERVGMGILGGSILMTLPILWTWGPTPFDYWSTALTRIGTVVYFLGRLFRHVHHWRANDAMIGDARGNLRS